MLCALSGGVDSSVAALLVHRAVGDKLTCVFVDTGLLRHGEAEQVEETFRRDFNINLVHVKAADRFLERLAGVTDPEAKRKAIGNEFIRVFEEVAKEHGDARYLVQGTLYPDVVESGGKRNATIKSHHNVGGLPERMDLELVEPLRLLFKDEVRRVGTELGLPEDVVQRQPFPGPAVRIVGEVTAERLETAGGRPHRARGDPPGRAGPRAVAVVRGAAGGPDRRGHGRRPHLRLPDRAPGRDQPGRHDGRLRPPSLGGAGAHLDPGRG